MKGASGKPWHPAEALSGADYSAVELGADGRRAFVLDQRLLPGEERYLIVENVGEMAEAIRAMVVRGAPAIGIAAAYGMALAAARSNELAEEPHLHAMTEAAALLCSARPTAVNLKWAVDRCLDLARAHPDAPAERAERLADLARQIHRQDVAACRAIGRIGAERLRAEVFLEKTGPSGKNRLSLLTHCNAGALATGGYGTALGVVRGLREAGVPVSVLADETRPYLQGARLTAWELAKDGIEVTVIADAMAAHFMQRGMVDAVVVGADRIAKNGDAANKIGTYGLACLARAHGVPFYVAAPESTVDRRTPAGAAIPIEERARVELALFGDRKLVPDEAAVLNPAFDVTPAALIRAIFTERGAFAPSELGC